MFDLPITAEVIAHGRAQATRYNFGHRRGLNGSLEQQVTGLIGQTAVHDLFGLPWPSFGKRQDSGIDLTYFGLRIDVKTTGRTVAPQPNYVSSLFAVQARSLAQVLLFCSFNRRTNILTVCGWFPKEEFIRRARLIPKGTLRERADGTCFVSKGAQYEIANSQLNSPTTVAGLLEELAAFASAVGARDP